MRVRLVVKRLEGNQVTILQKLEQGIRAIGTARHFKLVIFIVRRNADPRNGSRIDIDTMFDMADNGTRLIMLSEFKRPGFEGRRFVHVNHFDNAHERIRKAIRVGKDNRHLVPRVDCLVIELGTVQHGND